MNEIIMSMGFAISALFLLIIVVYVLIYKSKDNNYNNKIYRIMIAITFLVTFLEMILSVVIKENGPDATITNIIGRCYIYSAFLWTFTTFNHMANYNNLLSPKILKISEIILSIVFLILCIFVPINFTTEAPFSVYGPLVVILYTYLGIGSLVEALLITLKIIKLRDIPSAPFLLESIVFISIILIQLLTGYYFHFLSNFFTIVVIYLFYNTENQDSILVEKFEKIKKESEEKNQERNDFIINLSREIRTPVSNIVGYSNLIMLNQDNLTLEKVQTDGSSIHKESINLLNIINNILDLSRFEAGKEVKEDKEYTFESTIIEINNNLIDSYKDMKISYAFMNNMPNDLYGDNEKIEKLILLICNYMAKDRLNRSLDIEFKYRLLENNFVELNIVFKLNNIKAEGSLKQSKLELEKQIIDAYNSVLGSSFESIIDTKNSVICSLKIVQKVLSDRKVENIIEKLKKSSTNNNNNNSKEFDYSDKTILIVDDSQMNLNIAKRLFVKYGFKIEEANSGKECIKLASTKKYDIIFLDDMMPELSGVETLNEMLSMGINLPPVVALTANSYDGLKAEYVNKGFTDYLAKPIESNKLNKIIKSLLDKNGGDK